MKLAASWADSQANVQAVGTRVWGSSSPALMDTIGRMINLALSVLGVVFLVLALYAGFKWMTAGGNTKEVDGARESIKNNVIGLVIVMIAYALTTFIMTQLGSVLGVGG